MVLMAAWPTVTDDDGTHTTGTIWNAAWEAAVKASIEDQVHSATNPTVKPKTITDEVIAGRGAFGSLNARLVDIETDLAAVSGSGLLNSQYVNSGNIGGGVDTLYTYALPGGTLAADGKALEIVAWGTWAANANNKRIALLFGATTLVTTNLAGHNGGTWRVVGTIIRSGALTQRALGYLHLLNAAAASTHFQTETAPAETMAGAINIVVTGEGVADNDVIARGFLVRSVI